MHRHLHRRIATHPAGYALPDSSLKPVEREQNVGSRTHRTAAIADGWWHSVQPVAGVVYGLALTLSHHFGTICYGKQP
jgi:hypothetical protein